MRVFHEILELETGAGISVHDLNDAVRAFIARSGMRDGLFTVSSRHTTTALAINENEARLIEDIETFFARLVPPGDKYLHNDIHLRDCPPEEPENAHSHLLAMLLGSSESVPLVEGELALGRWQSILLFELDGPRRRQVNLHLLGA